MTSAAARLVGITFAKQFPNPAEPVRGLFVAEQVRATRRDVDWSVIAPVPWIPRVLAHVLSKPYVRGSADFEGILVSRPRYPVLPRRLLYTTVAPAMARCSRAAFARDAARGTQFVHAHALYPSGAAARRLCSSADLPLIVTVHGSDLYTNLERPSWAAEVRSTVAFAAATVCVSRSLAADAVALAGADPARVVVVPDTYDQRRFTYFERRPVGPRRVRLITVGRLVPVKGHDILLRSLGALTRAGVDAELTIVGDGPERGRLAALVSREGLSERVFFRGSLEDAALAAALAEADAFVLPSRREGFGVALVEALATGLPVVATRSGGPEDVVGSGDGLLVERDDAAALAEGITALAAHVDEYDRQAIAARAHARFSAASVGAQLMAIYRSVVAGRFVPGAGEYV